MDNESVDCFCYIRERYDFQVCGLFGDFEDSSLLGSGSNLRLRLHIITHLLRVSKDLLQALLEAVNVVIDQMLPVDLVLVDEADQG